MRCLARIALRKIKNKQHTCRATGHACRISHRHECYSQLSLKILPADIQALFGLFILCYIMHKTVERKGIQLGSQLLSNWKNRKRGMPLDSAKKMV
jgi:hypothetical protein